MLKSILSKQCDLRVYISRLCTNGHTYCMNGQFKIGELQPLKYFLAVAAVVGLLFTFVAPDDEPQHGWLVLAFQWQLQTLIPMFLAIAVHSMLSHIGLMRSFNAWGKLVASGFAAAILFTPLALVLDLWLGGQAKSGEILPALGEELVSIAPPIVLCWLAINWPFQVGYRIHRAKNDDLAERAKDSESEDAETGFTGLIPEAIRGEIIYLKSELHYL